MVDDDSLSSQLRDILGEMGFVLMCQELGGLRVYIPRKFRSENDIVRAIGKELAEKLGKALAPATIRVPLARRERALHYRASGLSKAQIARRLGITETGVSRLLAREKRRAPQI